MNNNLTLVRLKGLLDYDPITGHFHNKTTRSRFSPVGARAGCDTGHGYRRISIDGDHYYEHHLAWLYTYGEYPNEIDHADGDGSNNAIANLREVDRTENCFNSKRPTGSSGLRGAYLDKRTTRWYSKIQVRGQVEYLGSFNSPEEAHAAFMVAVDRYHGEFAYHNRVEATPI